MKPNLDILDSILSELDSTESTSFCRRCIHTLTHEYNNPASLINRREFWFELLSDVYHHWSHDIDPVNCIKILKKKNEMYGSKPLELTGLMGISVRLIDKFCRIENMVTKNLQSQTESISDTKIDIFNYCLLAVSMFQ